MSAEEVHTEEIPGVGLLTTYLDGGVVKHAVLRCEPPGPLIRTEFPAGVSMDGVRAHMTSMALHSAEPSLKTFVNEWPPDPALRISDPFPPWPWGDMPEVKEWVREMLTRCGHAGVVSLDSPGVAELLNLLDRHPLAPGPVLAHAEGMLSETGRHARNSGAVFASLYRKPDGEHAFWYLLVAALLQRRCVGSWPQHLPVGAGQAAQGADQRDVVLAMRSAAKKALAAAGVIPDEGEGGVGPA